MWSNYWSRNKNGEGYTDETAITAIKKVDKEHDQESYERFKDTLHVIKKICDIAGFEVEGRIVLRDKQNNRLWK